MQLFRANFVKNKCNFFRILVQQKLALIITLIGTEVGKTQLEAQLPQPLQLHKLRCSLIFYFGTLRKLCCGIKPLKFVALNCVALSKFFLVKSAILYIELNFAPFPS